MVKIELTKEIIEVLKQIRPEKINIGNLKNGIEILSGDLFYSSGVLENILMSWNKYDDFIPGSEKSFEGKRWDDELEQKAFETYEYIIDNLEDITSIVFTNVIEGVKPGIYKRKDTMKGIWEYKPFENNV